MKNICFLIVLNINFTLLAQVGINQTNPQATLDVTGNIRTETTICLENPGEDSEIRNSKLLVMNTNNEIVRYDIDISKYGPISYAEFMFENLSTNGLQDFDTKVSISEYVVIVQGFYFVDEINHSPEIVLSSSNGTNKVEGYQFYAYQNTTTNTWFIKAFVNNSTFVDALDFTNTNIDLYMNVLFYRINFITKYQNPISVSMANSETSTVPLPTGF